MKNQEIFAFLLKIVSNETCVNETDILSNSRITEIVDARVLLIQCLSDMGFYPRQIADMLDMTASNVRYLLTHRKRSKQQANNMQIIRKHLTNNPLAMRFD